MKAIIFAAGLGTRLQSLSQNAPKALVKVNEVPLLHTAIQHLSKHSFNDIIINVHHFADQIISFVQSQNYDGIKISFSDERDELLDTGGGLWKAQEFFDNEPFLAYNVDVISNINLYNLFKTHCNSNALATLAIRNRQSSRYLLFNNENELCGWRNINDKSEILSRQSNSLLELAFSGIHIISPEIFKLYNQSGKFSMTPVYLELAKKNIIKGYLHDEDYWFDTGTPEKLEEASNFLSKLID